MNIAVDLRSIQSGLRSGVEIYTQSLLERLLAMDKINHYTLFYNSFSKKNIQDLYFVNSTVVKKRIPNKLLNASLRLFNYPKFENYIGQFDCLFLPNINQFAIGPRTKLALTVHDLSPFITPEFYDYKRQLWHKSLEFPKALARANVIFAVSEYTKRDLVDKFKVPHQKIIVTHLGVNHTLFHPDLAEAGLREVRNRYGLPGKFILYLGTLEPRKNIPGLIQAFNQVEGDAHLVIAGRRGWRYDSIYKEIQNSPKRRHIKLLGFVDEPDKPYLLKLARVFAFPSFYEGFGLPVLEAMSVGTPVLASQLTSIPEVTGSSAMLINPYNIDDIAAGLSELLTNNNLRSMFVTSALERAKEFTWDKTAEKVYGSFQGLQ